MSDVLLEVEGLEKAFGATRRTLRGPQRAFRAVQGVDIVVRHGETVAVVGESGAGKSTLGRLLLRLLEPDRGSIRIDGVDLRSLDSKQLRVMRKRMQMIFQDPFSSLDPRMIIEESVGDPLRLHFGMKGVELHTRVLELLDRVGINEDQAARYPHEFSGGQLQRIAIARALAVEPDFIVCDEPVAALDVSIRAQVINLLADLQRERGVAYVFISHDLSLVRAIAHRVAIMYRGRVVEEGPTAALFDDPRHPYTRALLDAIPVPDPRVRATRAGKAKTSTADASGSHDVGCSYADRCPLAIDRCRQDEPTLLETTPGTRVSCHVTNPPTPGDL